ncbi:hypothetical protein KSF_007940 [Reticulibacter mediterranei]|uniref:Response regulatory domain-containing protein n=1 Tax=Reticulibacter mediterranei TaxID=2778369 RepID=A0A8J3IA78_9CHLR|nr:response regulator [Reticulibacter mediterranei]GHO90746.1 hypothetical protein KSF_007940 [Reticulibacter mediterranei]
MKRIRAAKELSSKLIVLVEDDDLMAGWLVDALKEETPYHIIRVATARQALHLLCQVHAHLLLLDFRLPDMTGIELFDQLRSRNTFQPMPTILTSASLLKQEHGDRLLTYLEKPFDFDELLQLIERMLS